MDNQPDNFPDNDQIKQVSDLITGQATPGEEPDDKAQAAPLNSAPQQDDDDPLLAAPVIDDPDTATTTTPALEGEA